MGDSQPLIYLAGAIDAVPGDEAHGWRDQAEADCLARGWATFNPARAFSIEPNEPSKEISDAIHAVNSLAICHSTAIWANLSGRSFGTPLEVESGRMLGKIVVCYGGSPASIYQHKYDGWFIEYKSALETLEVKLA
jgi:hypothetical protein